MYLLAKNRGIVSKLLYLIKDTNIQIPMELFHLHLKNTPLHRVEKQIKSTLNPSTNQKLIFS